MSAARKLKPRTRTPNNTAEVNDAIARGQPVPMLARIQAFNGTNLTLPPRAGKVEAARYEARQRLRKAAVDYAAAVLLGNFEVTEHADGKLQQAAVAFTYSKKG